MRSPVIPNPRSGLPPARLAALMLAVLALCGAPVASAQTNLPVLATTAPQNATVTTPTTGQMVIVQNESQQRAYIEWRDFSIGALAGVTVQQINGSSVLLNRVVGVDGTPPISRIDGTLTATGQVFILNPAGIVFGAGAQVQVGSLLAAAMDSSTSAANFLAGTPLVLDATLGGGALSVAAGAHIAARAGNPNLPGGEIVLIGAGGAAGSAGASGLTMDGSVVASGGRVLLAVSDGSSVPAAGIPVGASGFITLQLTSAAAGTLAMHGSVDVAGAVSTPSGRLRIEAPTVQIGNRTGLAATPVSLSGASVTALGSAGPGSLTISGSAENGAGIDLSNVTLSGDRIELRGTSLLTEANADLQPTGVRLNGVSIDIGDGSLLIAGRGELASTVPPDNASALGVGLSGLFVTSNANAGRSVTIVGEAVNSSTGAGIGAVNDGGFFIASNNEVDPSAANVVLAAYAGAQGRAYALFSAPDVFTSGRVNLRPAGVDANGAVQERPATPITLGGAVSSVPLGFNVPSAWLLDPRLNQGGRIESAGIVVGSSGHVGAISVAADALQAGITPQLTLQNGGAGSLGIQLAGASTTAGAVRQLALASAGAVTQTGPIAAQQLLLAGSGADAAVQLLDPGNQIGQLGFAGLRSVQVASAGAMTVAGGSVAGYDGASGALTSDAPASGTFTTQAITTSQAADRVLLRSGDGDLTLQQGIQAGAAGGQIDLVAGVLFQNPANATLEVGPGGRWRVWSDSWVGSQRGELPSRASLPTLYGCSFGDSSRCSVSQIALPAGGSGFLYSLQPDLVIVPSPVSASQGTFLPPITYSTTGLVNGDAPAQAVTGQAASNAALLSPPGLYAVTVGTLQSPTGYRLSLSTAADTAVRITPPDPLRSAYPDGMAQLLAASTSETHGRNLATPRMCLASGPASTAVIDDATADLLGLEWGRVRQQPQFSSCLELDRGGGACAGF